MRDDVESGNWNSSVDDISDLLNSSDKGTKKERTFKMHPKKLTESLPRSGDFSNTHSHTKTLSHRLRMNDDDSKDSNKCERSTFRIQSLVLVLDIQPTRVLYLA